MSAEMEKDPPASNQSMNCSTVRELLTPHLDGELPPADERRVSEHIAACAACERELDLQLRVSAGLAGSR